MKPIPVTKRESIRNKIAELTAHGLESNEILKHLGKTSAEELIEVIKDYQKDNEAHDILEDICNSFETAGCEDCGTVSTETINRAREFLGWR